MNDRMRIKYTKGYKYQLQEGVLIQTKIKAFAKADMAWLLPSGKLRIFKFFAWDGCSGPTIDDKTNMRAGLVHDALYYLMRVGALDKAYKRQADDELYRIMVDDGAPGWRARLYRWAVVKFGRGSLRKRKIHKIHFFS